MKNVIFLMLLLYGLPLAAQPEYFLESYPTKQELLKLNSTKTFTRASKAYVDEDDYRCEGKLKFFKKGRDIDIRPIGEWKHYFASGKVREVVLYDDQGNVKELFLFNEAGAFLSDSRYTYKKLDGHTYRIEKFSEYNNKGTVVKLEYWYSKVNYRGAFMEVSIPKKIGFWKEYDDSGTAVVETKEFKAKLAVSLGLQAR